MPVWLWAIVITAAVLLALVVGALLLYRSLRRETRAVARRIGKLPLRAKGRLAIGLMADPRVPLWVRGLVPLLVLYLALPIDIIPDFIPVLGQLDDLLVAAIVAGIALRSTPDEVIEEHLGKLELRP